MVHVNGPTKWTTNGARLDELGPRPAARTRSRSILASVFERHAADDIVSAAGASDPCLDAWIAGVWLPILLIEPSCASPGRSSGDRSATTPVSSAPSYSVDNESAEMFKPCARGARCPLPARTRAPFSGLEQDFCSTCPFRPVADLKC